MVETLSIEENSEEDAISGKEDATVSEGTVSGKEDETISEDDVVNGVTGIGEFLRLISRKRISRMAEMENTHAMIIRKVFEGSLVSVTKEVWEFDLSVMSIKSDCSMIHGLPQ
jgi:hypothetical protein